MPCLISFYSYDREENNDSDDTAHKSQETESHEPEIQQQTIDPLEQSKTYETSDATENPGEQLSDKFTSSLCILLTSIGTARWSNFRIVAATKDSDPNKEQNILGDIEKCKQMLANIKKSVSSLETTLENIST
ncbi:hypothetical protein XELAEV_18007519mg [Xenopus laevis]|uniref:Uncharacterized protein n=1 Tax=Xenopus laevis TaxID=8355 RepID=A0A974E326_XENLA|nr:hypothetical protein XELAEV_18007519mg [Xenopus laevis]